MLGHASAAMTPDQYGHLFGDRLDEVAERMAAARAALLPHCCPSPMALARRGRSERRIPSPTSAFSKCPRQDSNLRTRLRRAVLYPLSYGGSVWWGDQKLPAARRRADGGITARGAVALPGR